MFHVMIVDDDKALRYVYRKMRVWEQYDFQVTAEAANGKQALQILESQEIDIVFTDIRMPFMDGISFMKEAKKVYPKVSFVLISSYHEFEYARQGLREGALDYIVKPMEEQDLQKVLERLSSSLEPKEAEYLKYFKQVTDGKVNWSEPVIANACQYIAQHLDENVTLELLADILGLNKDYLGKLIKSRIGLNFRDFYNSFKIEYAKPLIKSGKYRIYEISDMLGYRSVDYFSRLFKKYAGVTPGEFKNLADQ